MYSIIITTCDSQEQSKAIIDELLARRLAACIQVVPIQSHYVWKGAVEQAKELQLLIKTRTEMYQAVENCIREKHSYELPEIIQVPIVDGSEKYLRWIDEQLAGK